MIDGYCWPQSGVAGDRIDLFVSATGPTCAVEIARIGREPMIVATHRDVEVALQAVPENVAVDGCGWASTLSIEIDAAWRSGFYLVRLDDGAGTQAEAFFVVRAVEPADALLVLSTSTWAAYNDWGGPSFYTGGHRSSQLRPLPRGFLDKPEPERYRLANMIDLPREERTAHFERYSMWSGAAGFGNWERLFVAWAEDIGLELDYATSHDLGSIPGLLDPYSLYLSVGHDEYWSGAMRDAVEQWVDQGGLAVFLSGNTAFWQIRFEGDDDHQVVGYKLDFDEDPVLGTPDERALATMWSDPIVARPESLMTGVSFTRGGYAHMHNSPRGSGGYSVWQPGHWAFDGLDVRVGDLVGNEPIVVGYECDGCELEVRDGVLVAAPSAATPDGLVVLGTAPAHLWATEEGAPGLPDSYVGELNWVATRLGGADTAEQRARFAHGHAVMATFARGHGEVFTVGCTDWAYGLRDPSIDRITRNVIGRAVALTPAD